MLSKSRSELVGEIRQTMQCVLSTSKQTVADLWEVKFEDKKGKLRITQIKDIKKNKVKYNIKKDSQKVPNKILTKILGNVYCLFGNTGS